MADSRDTTDPRRIITRYNPDEQKWTARDDCYDYPVGTGPTENEAVADLFQQIADEG